MSLFDNDSCWIIKARKMTFCEKLYTPILRHNLQYTPINTVTLPLPRP